MTILIVIFQSAQLTQKAMHQRHLITKLPTRLKQTTKKQQNSTNYDSNKNKNPPTTPPPTQQQHHQLQQLNNNTKNSTTPPTKIANLSNADHGVWCDDSSG